MVRELTITTLEKSPADLQPGGGYMCEAGVLCGTCQIALYKHSNTFTILGDVACQVTSATLDQDC
jgi:hypothetical protein